VPPVTVSSTSTGDEARQLDEPESPAHAQAEPAPVPVVEDPAPPEAPPAEPPRFDGREQVRVDELIAELDALVEPISESPAVRRDYEALLSSFDLQDSEALYRDYVRVKIAFEATRGGGLWHMQWRITNKKPNSTLVWEAWSSAPPPAGDALTHSTARAECDELSALFAYVVHRMGVKRVGLLWPVPNHTVAVWTVPRGEDERPARIVVPTSQIFLDADQSLGTREFNAWKQKNIFDYKRLDVKTSFEIPADLARFFVEQVEAHGHKSQAQLQRERNARDAGYPQL
jgi:hypothetical protein